MSGRDARGRNGGIVSIFTLLLFLKPEGALSGTDVPRVEVGDPPVHALQLAHST